jgi:high-affinity nickel permease
VHRIRIPQPGPPALKADHLISLHLNGAFWNVVANFTINTAGFTIVALFILVWVGALAYWRFGRVETRWAADLEK